MIHGPFQSLFYQVGQITGMYAVFLYPSGVNGDAVDSDEAAVEFVRLADHFQMKLGLQRSETWFVSLIWTSLLHTSTCAFWSLGLGQILAGNLSSAREIRRSWVCPRYNQFLSLREYFYESYAAWSHSLLGIATGRRWDELAR
jgi:hypothetical protein